MDENMELSKSAEIQAALKEFEIQNSTQAKQGVPVPKKSEHIGMAGWLVKHSGGKINQTQAEYILLGLAILAILISLFLFFRAGNSFEKGKSIEVGPELNVIPR